MSKHTPIPWVFDDLEMKIKGSGDIEGRTVIANVSPFNAYSRGKTTQCANAERIVACVNALDGIEDPQKFRDTWEAIKHLELDAYEKAKEELQQLREEIIQWRQERDGLRHQLQDLGKLAHEIVTENCKEHVAAAWRRKVYDVMGTGAGGGQ